MRVIEEVDAECLRQVDAEGWTAKHDDGHEYGEMARAAATYAIVASSYTTDGAIPLTYEQAMVKQHWPWEIKWWKPKDRRRDLIRAAALIVKEIERLDRIVPAPSKQKLRRPDREVRLLQSRFGHPYLD